MTRFIVILILALLITVNGPVAQAQSTTDNSVKIRELESSLNELRSRNAELEKLVKSFIQAGTVNSEPSTQSEQPIDVQYPIVVLDTDKPSPSLPVHALTASDVNQLAAIAFEGAEPLPLIADGGQSTPGRSSASAVGITAGKDSSRVAISLSDSKFRSQLRGSAFSGECTLGDGVTVLEDDNCGKLPTTYQQDVTGLSISAPVAKSGDSSFATLDGLSSGIKTEIRHTRYFGDIPDANEINRHQSVEAARRRCLAANKEKPENCTTVDAKFRKRYMSISEQESYSNFVFDKTVANSYGVTVSGSIGYEEFSFFPDLQFEEQEVEKISTSVGAGLIYFPSRGSSMLFEGQYQRTFKAADSLTRCRTMADPDNDFLTCATGAFEGPGKKEKFIVSPQYRQQIPLSSSGLIQNLAIAPRFEFDVLSDDYALDVPFYLVSGKKEGMVAGVRVGYEEEDDKGDFKLGVFYGKSFDLTPF